MKECKKVAANGSPPFAEKYARRGRAALVSPYEHPNDLSGHDFLPRVKSRDSRAASTVLSGHDFSRAGNATTSARLQPLRATCSRSNARSFAHESHFWAFSAHSSNAPSFTRIALTNREETLRGVLKSVSVRKDPHPLFSITYGWL
jgi:hypothetical protein